MKNFQKKGKLKKRITNFQKNYKLQIFKKITNFQTKLKYKKLRK